MARFRISRILDFGPIRHGLNSNNIKNTVIVVNGRLLSNYRVLYVVGRHLEENLKASKPSEHPPSNIGYKDKNSS